MEEGLCDGAFHRGEAFVYLFLALVFSLCFILLVLCSVYFVFSSLTKCIFCNIVNLCCSIYTTNIVNLFFETFIILAITVGFNYCST